MFPWLAGSIARVFRILLIVVPWLLVVTGLIGFYYLRARMMNPLTGRFWSADSYEGHPEDPQSLHKYLYCGAEPVNGRDPSGYFTSIVSDWFYGQLVHDAVGSDFLFETPGRGNQRAAWMRPFKKLPEPSFSLLS